MVRIGREGNPRIALDDAEFPGDNTNTDFRARRSPEDPRIAVS
jgi:hypothetical protein